MTERFRTGLGHSARKWQSQDSNLAPGPSVVWPPMRSPCKEQRDCIATPFLGSQHQGGHWERTNPD